KIQSYRAFVGELHRVAGEVDEDLPNLVDVTRHADRSRRDAEVEREILLTGEWFDDGDRRAHEVGREKVRRSHRLAPFVQTREGEHLFDHRGEMTRHRLHALEYVDLSFRQWTDHFVDE